MEQHEQQQIHIDEYERRWITALTIMLGVFFASLIAGAAIFGVRPAQEGGFINPNKLNETMFANPGVRHMGGNRYEVVMTAQAWSFNPREITVPKDSVVTFYVTSSDVTHGFIIEHHNVNFEIVPGHIVTSRVHFREEGEFKFLCHEYCGRGHQTMYGTIYVTGDDQTVATGE
jgi:cytochrome c oxidase subunit II